MYGRNTASKLRMPHSTAVTCPFDPVAQDAVHRDLTLAQRSRAAASTDRDEADGFAAEPAQDLGDLVTSVVLRSRWSGTLPDPRY
jgi:hypothetical protein